MIRINLLPYRAALRRRQVAQHLAIGGGVVVLCLLLLAGWHLVQQGKADALREELAALKQQNRAIEHKIGEIKNIEKLRREVESKLKLVDRLQGGRFRVLTGLYEIAHRIPDDVWLLALEDRGREIQLSGRAENNKAVAVFMRRLDAAPLFSEVRLLGITRQRIAGRSVREFRLLLSRAEDAGNADAQKTRKGRR